MSEEPVGFAGVPLWMVRDANIDQHMLLVFLALSSHLGRHDVVWPGQDTIAKEARLGVTSVKEALVRLRNAGLVQWRRRPTGSGYVNEYRILVSSLSRWDSRPAAVPQGQPPSDRGTAAQRLQGQPPSGYEVDPQEVDPGKDSSSSADDGASSEDDLFADFWEFYPKKVGKKDARSAFAKAMKRTDYPTIRAGLVRAIKAWRSQEMVTVAGAAETLTVRVAAGDKGKGVPHGATWLNGDRWEDQHPEPEQATGDGTEENSWMHRRA